MSIINPNNRPILLVDDFIQLAKEHLLTVEGQATCLTSYSTSLGVPLPGLAKWKGYDVPPEKPINPEDIPNLPTQKTKFKGITGRVFAIPEYNLEEDLIGTGISMEEYIKLASGPISAPGTTAQTTFTATNDEARKAAEAYLGKPMSDDDWNNLVALTNAESSPNQTERAWVMGVILNRTRIGFTPLGIRNTRYKFETVTDIINQPWQFQPVTGTRKAPGPNPKYINGPNTSAATSIYGAASKILKDVPKAFTLFTSNSEGAYTEGTNINYLFNLRSKPQSVVKGGTIFSY
jgi:hypothetical protein